MTRPDTLSGVPFGRNAPFRLLIRLACVFSALAPASSQEVPSLSFEVASIKPATVSRVQGKLHLGLKVDGDRVDIGFMSIADLIGKACGVKSWQIAGPPWIRTSRFDVLAKIPAGVGKDRVPDMLRSLLAERFQLKLHSQPTEQAVYVLLAGKGGPRLLPAVSEIPAPGAPEPKEQSLTSNGSVSSYRNGKLRATKISTNEGGTILL